jgi:hypothetical protein
MQKKLIILCLISLIVISCKKKEFYIVNLNGNKKIALGHTGFVILFL